MKYGTWTVSSYEPADARALCAAGFSPITAALLCSRGYRDADAARAFLSCSYPLSSPFDLLDMDKAAARVRLALQRREHIAVFGDYDVDGITATCLLTEFLKSRGGHVTSYIPARLEEGYGLNAIAIDTLKKQGVELIVTVDCGITANAEAALCRQLGIDLVITDHHECKSDLPEAVALVDPHRKDQPQPVTEMAGVGVAFKLAAAIAGEQEKLLDEYCDFLCLGTVADVMPLTGENRTMVARGLKALANPKRVGIAALMAECSVQKGPVTAGTIGYTLAPRINAAGRMGEVNVATELFLTHDAARAVELASALCRLNRKRQEIESSIYQSAVAMLPPGDPPQAIVLADESWHQGVVGIVASRMAEEYSCPTFLICLDGEKGKASSRSYGGFNLFRSLEQLSGLLESYGGHELAAGFTIRRLLHGAAYRLRDPAGASDHREYSGARRAGAVRRGLPAADPLHARAACGRAERGRRRQASAPAADPRAVYMGRDLLLHQRPARRRGAGRHRGHRVHPADQRIPRHALGAAESGRYPAGEDRARRAGA